ncbi:hypothetical protein BV898_19096 [Hypsibius exemplaris]|uniref:Uncharacterized protein n=1 Tax=Hypsibius exemplaris TaxID=2072580 RepID=A0A9X6RP39_HYPEX|nr:hypothetical protein BV898_19096 [Hypsibius exemplaris]
MQTRRRGKLPDGSTPIPLTPSAAVKSPEVVVASVAKPTAALGKGKSTTTPSTTLKRGKKLVTLAVDVKGTVPPTAAKENPAQVQLQRGRSHRTRNVDSRPVGVSEASVDEEQEEGTVKEDPRRSGRVKTATVHFSASASAEVPAGQGIVSADDAEEDLTKTGKTGRHRSAMRGPESRTVRPTNRRKIEATAMRKRGRPARSFTPMTSDPEPEEVNPLVNELAPADAVATSEAEKNGVFDAVDEVPLGNRPMKKVLRSPKLAKTALTARRNDPTGEPNICTRCENKPAGMEHFYRFHNGLLAVEQATLPEKEKRNRWTFTIKHKKCKLRCQVLDCRKTLNSTTAMIYHEKICGVKVERLLCKHCQRMISSACFRQHQREHERVIEEVSWRDAKQDAPEPKVATTSTEAELEVKNEPTGEEGGRRPKRKSAVAALKNFRPAEDEEKDELEDYEDDEDKYQPSDGTDDEADIEGDGDNEEEVECVDSEADEDEEPGRGDKTGRDRKNGQLDRMIGFRPTVQFARLNSLWRRSLDVLGYAQCEVPDCGHVETSLAGMLLHYRKCRLEAIKKSVKRCAVRACSFRYHRESRLLGHYIKKHRKSLAEARAMLKEKRPVPDALAWRPSQEEIDALKLFD